MNLNKTKTKTAFSINKKWRTGGRTVLGEFAEGVGGLLGGGAIGIGGRGGGIEEANVRSDIADQILVRVEGRDLAVVVVLELLVELALQASSGGGDLRVLHGRVEDGEFVLLMRGKMVYK